MIVSSLFTLPAYIPHLQRLKRLQFHKLHYLLPQYYLAHLPLIVHIQIFHFLAHYLLIISRLLKSYLHTYHVAVILNLLHKPTNSKRMLSRQFQFLGTLFRLKNEMLTLTSKQNYEYIFHTIFRYKFIRGITNKDYDLKVILLFNLILRYILLYSLKIQHISLLPIR